MSYDGDPDWQPDGDLEEHVEEPTTTVGPPFECYVGYEGSPPESYNRMTFETKEQMDRVIGQSGGAADDNRN